MLIKEVFSLLKEGVFVKIYYFDTIIYGEIIKKEDHIYIASNNNKLNGELYLKESIDKGYKYCGGFHKYNTNTIEILSELPEEHKPHQKEPIKGRVCDLIDKLKPGVFVKTRADSYNTTEYDTDIIGEIGLLGFNRFYILTNNVGSRATGYTKLEEFASWTGYKYVWIVHNDNKSMIEILDELPKEEIREEITDISSGELIAVMNDIRKPETSSDECFIDCPLNEMRVFQKKLQHLTKQIANGYSSRCSKCNKLDKLANELRDNTGELYVEIHPDYNDE